MIAYSKIHCELTNLCNAACPSCPRNISGADVRQSNDWVDNYVTLEQFKHWWRDGYNKNITHFWINGNYGDFVMNPESLDIIEYVTTWDNIEHIHINTNGSARNSDWRQKLASILKNVPHLLEFAIDGLEDTHHLYRQNTIWKRIISNASAFINSGGSARWTMTQFRENMHQVEACKSMAHNLGFKEFSTRISTRHQDGIHTPVFNNNFENTHNLHHVSATATVPLMSADEGKAFIIKKQKEFNVSNDLMEKSKEFRLNFIRSRYESKFQTAYKSGTIGEVDCMYPLQGSLYIDSFGNVWPCCFMGHSIQSGGKYAKHFFINYKNETGKTLNDITLNNQTMNEILFDTDSFVNYVTNIIKGPFNIERAFTCYEFCGKNDQNWNDRNPHTFVKLN